VLSCGRGRRGESGLGFVGVRMTVCWVWMGAGGFECG